MDFSLLIDGQLVAGELALDVINPATEQVIATASAASRAQLDQAVAAARRAFAAWRAMPLAQRQAALARAAELTRAHAQELARLLSQEQGKPLSDAQGEIALCAGLFDYHAALPPTVLTPAAPASGRAQLQREGPGYFIRPAIVCEVKDGDRIVDEEQFGPVLPVIRYTDVDAVVERVNASAYGLGASVWSGDREAALAIAGRIDAGSVWVNTHFVVSPDIPFGGARQSGIGAELGEQGLAEFTQLKVLAG